MNNYDNLTREQLIEKIERLYKEIDNLHFALSGKIAKFRSKEVEKVKARIDKAIEYIKEKYDYILKDDTFLDHDERIDRKQMLSLLEILKGSNKE